jgi:Protein of unknown function (DUF2961)
MNTALGQLMYRRNTTSKRASSWDRTGGNKDYIAIEQGEERVIFQESGPARISHIWMTLNCEAAYYFRKILIRMYWDGEEHPSVEVPLGDFFGVGHGVANHYVSLPLNMITKQGSPQSYTAMNSYFSMPFKREAKIVIVNESEEPIPNFYFYIDYECYDRLDDDVLYFHACWNRENPTKGTLDMEALKHKHSEFRGPLQQVADLKNIDGNENYVILDAEGYGHFVGCNLSIDHINPVPNVTWFGEGDDMIFIDGETWPPSLHGTGTEDYFCTAWDFPSGKYDAPYHGISLAEPLSVPAAWEEKQAWGGGSFGYSGKWTAYRYHIEDPIVFKKSIRMTIEHGHGNSLSNDYASTAYWYQGEPHKTFNPMLPAALRLPLTNKQSLANYTKSI